MASAVKVRKKPIIQRQRPVTTNDAIGFNPEDIEEPTDLHLLKEVSQKLNLATRRPSTVQWKQVIEFRKSQGFYSSDVEPEFLDKIVGAKLKKSVTEDLTNDIINQDDVENNNIKLKTSKSQKSKSSEKIPSESKKNGFIFPGFHLKKDRTSSKKTKSSTRGEKELEITATTSPIKTPTQVVPECENSNDDLNKNYKPHCDITKPVSKNGNEDQTQEQICRFPLYDTDDENDDVTTGMSATAIRYRNITRALGKIRRDLITMRIEDNKLARKLLDARTEINLIRVRQSCDAHAEMLDDVTYELEEDDLLPGLIKACDLPNRQPGSLMSAFSPLRTMGLSRMNLNRRRFSIR
ncbi:uncharacterized protein LOC120331839 [Styela clava]